MRQMDIVGCDEGSGLGVVIQLQEGLSPNREQLFLRTEDLNVDGLQRAALTRGIEIPSLEGTSDAVLRGTLGMHRDEVIDVLSRHLRCAPVSDGGPLSSLNYIRTISYRFTDFRFLVMFCSD